MNSTITLKDIAQNLGVSIGTVHRAIYNKGGVSESLRKTILEEVARSDYKINTTASALRRRKINIAVILPSPQNSDEYYFKYIWQGIDELESELASLNIHLIKYYSSKDKAEYRKHVEYLLKDNSITYHGMVLYTWDNSENFNMLIEKCNYSNLHVFFMNNSPVLKNSRSFHPETNQTPGNLAGEMICNLCPEQHGKVILLGGGRNVYKHNITTQTFKNYMNTNKPTFDIIEIQEFKNEEKCKRLISEYLDAFKSIVAIYSNNATETLLACETVAKLNLDHHVKIIGSDVFDKLSPYFDDKTLTASIYQYPKLQITEAVKYTVNAILGMEYFNVDLNIPCSAVFSSNARLFL